MNLIVLTDRHRTRRPLVEVVVAAVAGGARHVVLREKDLPDDRRLALAAELAEVAPGLVVAGRLPGWSGPVHLSRAESLPAHDRPPLVGRSCHGADELAAAAAECVDYVTVSPVFPTTSKPGYGPPLRPSGLAALCATTTLPVYALGGIRTPEDVRACRSAGAAGVAIMGAVMRAPDPTRFLQELIS